MSGLDYRNKVILAPMVRAGTLPLRLLSLDYGADIVYCEELIDWKLIRSTRKINDALGTVDYIDRTDGTVVFRTCDREKGKVVLQIGTCSPERALAVAMKVKDDVAAIDVNMGCPKVFSLKGGMGAALLSKPDLACSIISTLSSSLSIPVTCKIRVQPSVEDTLDLCRRLEASGASAIAIHGRRIDERPQHPNRNDEIAQVAKALSIPVIANGGSKEIVFHEDIERFRLACGASSVMVARTAQKDCTIFRKGGPLTASPPPRTEAERKVPVDLDVRWKTLEPLVKDYLYYSVRYASPAPNVKYCIQAMLKDLQESPLGKRFLEAQTLQQICDIWGMGEFCRLSEEQQRAQLGLCSSQPVYVPQVIRTVREVSQGVPEDDVVDHCGRMKRIKTTTEGGKDNNGGGNDGGERGIVLPSADCQLVELHIAFLRSLYKEDRELPKTQLLVISRKKHLAQPKYRTEQVDKLFRSEVLFDGRKYTSTYWEKNKRAAEQGAALACLVSIGAVQPSDHALVQRARF